MINNKTNSSSSSSSCSNSSMVLVKIVAAVIVLVGAAVTALADLKDYILTQPKKQFCSEYQVICNFMYFYKMQFFLFYFNALYS